MTSSTSPDARLRWITPLALFLAVLALYLLTLAPDIVFGDPSEYTFIPAIWGVAHPPGYALMTLLGGLWQRIIPFGSIPWRANLLSAFAGAGISVLVYGIVRSLSTSEISGSAQPPAQGWLALLPPIFAGLSAAAATNLWQHSLHANSHIITALLASASAYLLIRWWVGQAEPRADRWLFAFCVLAGLSVSHHPLLVFGFPAYTAFIISVRPRILLDWKRLLAMIGFGLLGLTPWLYLPLRATLPTPIPFGPTGMNTLDGFLNLVLARGLVINTFYFGWTDQAARLLVLGSILNLQAAWPVLLLSAAGLALIWQRDWRIGLLFSTFLVIWVGFVINSIQDVMAYLLAPCALIMALAGYGLAKALTLLRSWRQGAYPWMAPLIAVLVLVFPLVRIATLAPRVSLRGFTAARAWVETVYRRFEGRGEGAILLGHWEHLTPLWVAQYVEDRTFAEHDLRLVFVASGTERPWVDATWANIDAGPIYVSGYQPDLIREGFRLRPVEDRLYRVLPPGSSEPLGISAPLNLDGGPVTLLSAELGSVSVAPGELVHLVLTMQIEGSTNDIYFPVISLGDWALTPTTDSHWLTPYWQPGEALAERYDFFAPLNAAPGDYPLRVGLRNLSTNETVIEPHLIGNVRISGEAPSVRRDDLLAALGQQIGLAAAQARIGLRSYPAIWPEAIPMHHGETLTLTVRWRALNTPSDNWKVFVQLVDGAYQPVTQVDAPPLGGSFPTYLWFPKWLPGQQVVDPYRLTIPPGTPPGEYRIIVGMYDFNTGQRLHYYDSQGNLSGDFFVLGSVNVIP